MKLAKWPDRYSGTDRMAVPASQASATVTRPLAMVRSRLVRSRHSATLPSPTATATPTISAVTSFHSPITIATTSGITCSAPSPTTTLPR